MILKYFDSDADLDLYIVSGGNEFEPNSPILKDRVYANDGLGNFIYSEDSVPNNFSSGMRVSSEDYDKDGDLIPVIYAEDAVKVPTFPFKPSSRTSSSSINTVDEKDHFVFMIYKDEDEPDESKATPKAKATAEAKALANDVSAAQQPEADSEFVRVAITS